MYADSRWISNYLSNQSVFKSIIKLEICYPLVPLTVLFVDKYKSTLQVIQLYILLLKMEHEVPKLRPKVSINIKPKIGNRAQFTVKELMVEQRILCSKITELIVSFGICGLWIAQLLCATLYSKMSNKKLLMSISKHEYYYVRIIKLNKIKCFHTKPN